MELLKRLLAKQATPYDYNARIEDLIHMHARGKHLSTEECLRIGAEVLWHALIEANNAKAASGEVRTNPVARTSFREEYWPLIDRVSAETIGMGREGLRQFAVLRGIGLIPATALVVATDCLARNGAGADGLDTEGIRRLVGSLYGVALELQRRDPELTRWMVEFDMAVQQRQNRGPRLETDTGTNRS